MEGSHAISHMLTNLQLIPIWQIRINSHRLLADVDQAEKPSHLFVDGISSKDNNRLTLCTELIGQNALVCHWSQEVRVFCCLSMESGCYFKWPNLIWGYYGGQLFM